MSGSLALSGLELETFAAVTFVMLNLLISTRASSNRLGALWFSPIGASLGAAEALS